MHIALAPFRLKNGVSEEALLRASDRFEEEFVRTQDGILRRVLVKDGDDGSSADLVFFRDLAVIERVIEAEQDSAACADFFTLLAGESPHRVYEVVKSYD